MTTKEDFMGREIYRDDYLTIVSKDGKHYFHFRNFDKIPKHKRISIFLQYFMEDTKYMPKEALVDLVRMSFEIVRGKLTYRDVKYLDKLSKMYYRKDVLASIWNMILAEEGLGFVR